MKLIGTAMKRFTEKPNENKPEKAYEKRLENKNRKKYKSSLSGGSPSSKTRMAHTHTAVLSAKTA